MLAQPLTPALLNSTDEVVDMVAQPLRLATSAHGADVRTPPATSPAPRSARAGDRTRGRGPWIGLILVEAGRISPADVQRVVQAQRETALRFGETARKLGLLTVDDVDYALSRQFAFPYVTGETGPLAPQLVAAHQPRHPACELLRGVRGVVAAQAVSPGRRNACMAVVSHDRGDGRSFTAANLAIVFAQSGRRTLLVDGNMREPSLHTLFKLDNTMGLSTMLAGRSGAEAIHRVAALSRLFVLPSGPTPPNPLELIEHPRFEQWRRRADERFQVVIVDTPAMALGADARALSTGAGAALLVARSNRTRVALARADVRTLEQAHVNVLGLVYNSPT